MTTPVLWLTGCIQLYTLMFSVHPIHVSVTEIEFDREDRALEIMMRVFIDDLELSLRNTLKNPTLDILNPPRGTTTDDLVRGYLLDHFRISLDNVAQTSHYLGHEREGDAFIFYIEITNVRDWKTISVRNDIIMATHDDQSNLVHVYVADKVKSLRLTRHTPDGQLTFD